MRLSELIQGQPLPHLHAQNYLALSGLAFDRVRPEFNLNTWQTDNLAHHACALLNTLGANGSRTIKRFQVLLSTAG
jgi:hypothetical protein